MRKSFVYLALPVVALMVVTCVKPPDYPDEPVITDVMVNRNTISQASQNGPIDTLIITIAFTDGDGDLSDDETEPNIELIDSRDSTVIPNRIPSINEQGTENGIRGEIKILIPNKTGGSKGICCIFPDRRICSVDPRYPTNTYHYSVRIKDRAGNWSNSMDTEDITILCQ
jgi:hypothetical protein